MFTNTDDMIIIIVTEFDSPDNAKKVQEDFNATATAKTINGHEGIEPYGNGAFHYCKDKYFIKVTSTDGSLFKR